MPPLFFVTVILSRESYKLISLLFSLIWTVWTAEYQLRVLICIVFAFKFGIRGESLAERKPKGSLVEITLNGEKALSWS